MIGENNMDDISGIKTTIFFGDLKMEPYWKQWSHTDIFTCIRYTKSGLVIVSDPNGVEAVVPKRHLTCFCFNK